MRLLLTLCDTGFSVHRASALRVKHFICSLGHRAKTDPLDARALAEYAHERQASLDLFVPQNQEALALYELVKRRQDLKQMLVAEKNRLVNGGKKKMVALTALMRKIIVIANARLKEMLITLGTDSKVEKVQ